MNILQSLSDTYTAGAVRWRLGSTGDASVVFPENVEFMPLGLFQSGTLDSPKPEKRADDRSGPLHTTFVFLALSAATFAIAYAFPVFGPSFPDYGHLGAEYFNIAQALVDGRGFADPFGQPSGPTSWMPPLFCLFLAVLMLLFKSKALVSVVVAACTNVAWAFVGTVMFRVARRHCSKIVAGIAPVTFFAWLCVFYSQYFLLTHDIWFIALFVSLYILQISTHVHTGKLSGPYWGLLGGCSALVNPSLLLAWTLYTWSLFARKIVWRKQLYVAIACAGIIASPWVIRNAVVFHRLIPTKSNLGFDAYQAQKIDDDGIYDDWSFQQHPYSSLRSRQEYVREGEALYVARYGQAFVRSIRHRPGAYLKRVARRFLAATMVYPETSGQVAGGFGHTIRLCSYASPCVCALLTLLCRSRHREILLAMRISYFAYILPYWFFAFYVRHLFPLTIVLLLFIVLALDQALAHSSKWHCRLATHISAKFTSAERQVNQ